MDQALQMRQAIIYFYKRHEVVVNMILKFFVGFFVFHKLSSLSAGAISDGAGILASVVGGIVTSVAPPTGFFILTMLGTGVFLSFASLELAICAMILFFLIIVFYSRIFPQESLLIPAMLVAYYFKIPYAVPIFAGIYVGFIGIMPIMIGSFLWSMIPFIKVLSEAAPRAEFTPLGMPDNFIKLYVAFLDILSKNKEWAVSGVIFTLAVILTAIIAHMAINYARQISAVAAGILMLISFFTAIILKKVELSLVWLVIGVIISIIVIWLISFFEMVLDYPRSDKVEFEDNDNYYYVKIVPKIIVEEDIRYNKVPSWEKQNKKRVKNKRARESYHEKE